MHFLKDFLFNMPVFTKEWHNTNCLICSKLIRTSHARWLDGRGKACSKSCGYKLIGIKSKGRKMPLEARKKLSMVRGKKHWNWKGGQRKLNSRIRILLIYRLWRNEIHKLCDYTCQHCFKKGGELEVHHINSFSLTIYKYGIKTLSQAEKCKDLWKVDKSFAISLCRNCHVETMSSNDNRLSIVMGQPKHWNKPSVGKFL